MFWYNGQNNGGPAIKVPDDWTHEDKPSAGSHWFGTKQNAFLDERSNNPRPSRKEAMTDFRRLDIPEKYPRVKGGPHREWVRAIKGEGPEPGSNFDYAAPMTEIPLLGVIAQRFGGRIEWDAKAMKITNRTKLNAYVQEPVREGWEYGKESWS